jgi:SAM-dependent methyltransferase
VPRAFDRFYFEARFASRDDPWGLASDFEQTKYARTISLLDGKRYRRALELGCAEGRFTELLAPLVDSLVAADISRVALDRAAERCSRVGDVSFVRLDLVDDDLPGTFDLIVCSELLYYVGDKDVLVAVARKLADALEPGGILLSAHSNVLVDDPARPGYDWSLPFGAKEIAEALVATEPLRLVMEFAQPEYCIVLLRADGGLGSDRDGGADDTGARTHELR